MLVAQAANDADTVAFLAAHGADLDAPIGKRTETALLRAARSPEGSAVVRALVEGGANVRPRGWLAMQGLPDCWLRVLLFAGRFTQLPCSRCLFCAVASRVEDDIAASGSLPLRKHGVARDPSRRRFVDGPCCVRVFRLVQHGGVGCDSTSRLCLLITPPLRSCDAANARGVGAGAAKRTDGAELGGWLRAH